MSILEDGLGVVEGRRKVGRVSEGSVGGVDGDKRKEAKQTVQDVYEHDISAESPGLRLFWSVLCRAL